MKSNQQQIKRDVFKIYGVLYKINGKSKSLGGLFDKKILDSLSYPVEDVEEALFADNILHKKLTENKLSQEISEIKTKQDVYAYFIKYLSDVCKAITSKNNVDSILKGISLLELKYLYAILADDTLKAKVTKKDIVYRIKDYFDNEERTRDLAKTIIS